MLHSIECELYIASLVLSLNILSVGNVSNKFIRIVPVLPNVYKLRNLFSKNIKRDDEIRQKEIFVDIFLF